MGNFGDLPSDVMLDIFTRLPAESVVDCKFVSKSWNKVLRRPSFNQMHSNLLLSNLDSAANSGKLRFIFKMSDRSLGYLEYDDEDSSHKFKKLKLNPPFDMYRVIGSCNGLVCISGLPNHYTIDESSGVSYVAYICNPITGESITLPELNRSWYYELYFWMLSGFGYVGSTNEYKVVRLYYFKKEPEFAHIEVYTLGSGRGWRNVGKINKHWDFVSAEHAVFVDGFLYWNFGKGKLVAFDLANEIFVELDEYYNETGWGGVLGGHYRRLQFSIDDKCSDVWLLKKKEDKSFSWSKEFSLTRMDGCTVPLALTSNGTVLCYSSTKLYLYDLKSTYSKMLGDIVENIGHAVPHMNTLVSLKAFGEENMETGRSAEAIET